MVVKHYLFIALIAFTIAASLAADDCLQLDDETTLDSRDSKTKLFKGQQIFTVDFLRELLKNKPNENVFFSPYSLYRALLLAYVGSRNATEQSLYESLNLHWAKDKAEVLSAYKNEKSNRLSFARQEKALEFESADKFYFNEKVDINSCVLQQFNDEVEKLSFENPAKAVEHINDWVSSVTREQIKNLLSADAVDPNSKLVLANAAYFKGLWRNSFSAEDTLKEPFYVRSDEIKFVDMMSQTGRFKLAADEELGCHVIEIPYNQTTPGQGTSLIVFLPPFAKENALNEVLSRLTPETLANALNEGQMQQVELKLPKITLETTTKVVPIFEALGMGSVFGSDADFSGFSDTSKVEFNDAIHKAKIEIDEKGSKAAAATAIFMFRSSRPLEPFQFFCNHPFLFMIYDHKTRAVLFAGIYRAPE